MVKLRGAAAEYLAGIPVDEFVRAQGDRWSPGDHVRHLAKSDFAIAKGLTVPRFMLRVAFGSPRAESRRFLTLIDAYRAALSAGGQAGPFAPEAKPLPPDLDGYRREVIDRWCMAHAEVVAGARRWDEAALDRYAIKHPLLGRLTVREMLMFAHYHESHHLNLLAARRA